MLLKNGRRTSASLTEQQLAEHRPVLFRYALLQLRDHELAEDAVQETMLAAWQAAESFEGKAGLRTWLIGILKHKIADHWRRNARETVVAEVEADHADTATTENDFFMSDGHWNHGPSSWHDPEKSFEQQAFWSVFEACQNNLPPKMGRVFMLRELVGLDAEEICRETGLSDANYWVTMHRARLRLRECLEIRWFNQSKAKKGNANA